MTCFVILHYMAMEETVTCIERIRALDGEKRIIVVDNASPDGTGKRLREAYADAEDVDIILHPKNDGFARGNNAGCAYAKEMYHPDFYVVLNNDIEIRQRDFITGIETIWETYRFDVLGPDVYAVTEKRHQSPKSAERTGIENSRRLLARYRGKVNSRVIVPLWCRLKQNALLRKIHRDIRTLRDTTDRARIRFDVPLHGSCLIFSARFMERRKQAFFPGTFFYYETEILDYECAAGGYRTMYDPSLRVYHHQNASTKTRYRDALERTRFMNREMYRSISAFLKAYG
ncbi:MAG: glycosyltransferase family 2 protein [Lachnospiraceae bacterium]|nr:glycosyltransferase family 2 protein [Lachnospiraceae bacterium]